MQSWKEAKQTRKMELTRLSFLHDVPGPAINFVMWSGDNEWAAI